MPVWITALARRLAITIAGVLLALFVLYVVVLPHLTGHAGARLHARVAHALSHAALTALDVLAPILLAGVTVALVAVLGHVAARYARRPGPSHLPRRLADVVERRRAENAPVWMEIVLGRDDRAMPYELSKLFDGLAGALRPATAPGRLLVGASTLTLQLVNDPDARTLRFLVAVRADAVRMLADRMRITYPDVRLRPAAQLPLTSEPGPLEALHARLRGAATPRCGWSVVRLRKRRRWWLALQTTKDYQHSPIESIVGVMAGSGERAIVSLSLTPTPVVLERVAARAIRRHERRLRADSDITSYAPGPESAVAQKQLRGAIDNVGRSLYALDYRILVPRGREQLARHLAGMAHEGADENDLRSRRVRARLGLYVARTAHGIPPLFPSVRTAIVSSAELATLWQLPTLRVRNAGLVRSGARELPAEAGISREPRDMLLTDELGPVGIAPNDRRYGWAVMGAAGGGKTAALLRHIGNTARDRERALLVIDPKVDLARDALTVIPRDRVVHYLDLGHPHVGFNPLTLLRGRGVSVDVIADVVVSAIRETSAEGAVGARSDQFLRGALMAVCTVEDEPTLHHVYRMLDPDDASYRDWVVRELEHHPEAGFLRDFWGRRFTARAANPKFLAEIMEAPLNKLSRFLAVPSLAYLTSHPVPLDLSGIIDRREVLVLNGSKGSVGEDNAVLVCQMLTLLVQKMLHQQQELERGARMRCALVIDEAHNVFSPSFATMLSEGRSGGIEVAAAFQYTGQIVDERVRAGIRSLLQNISVFRMREFDDARQIAALAMEVYADNIRGDEDDARRLRIDPIDVINLPNFLCINLWIADGRPRHAFYAGTLPIEPTVARFGGLHAAAAHRRRQRQRGWHPHDVGRYITDPLVWTIDTPVLAHDGNVYVDLTTWTARPAPTEDLLIVLRQRGESVGYPAVPADRSGRRFVTYHKPDDVAGEAIAPPAPGVYEVRVLVPVTEAEWRPMVTEGTGEQAMAVPATVTVTAERVRDVDVALEEAV